MLARAFAVRLSAPGNAANANVTAGTIFHARYHALSHARRAGCTAEVINMHYTIVQSHNLKAQSVWNSPAGEYNDISRSIADAIEHAVERLQPKSGERVLDLATGTGWASRAIAQRFAGVDIIGVDIAEKLLDYARGAAATLRLAIEYHQADAEALPFDDGEFDAVLSTFGVMFATRPDAAATELARVVRPGGRVVLATWKPESNVFHMFAIMKKFMPAPTQPAPPSPFEWGNTDRLRQLLGAHFDLRFEDGTNRFRYATGQQAWELWLHHYGPTKSLADSLDGMRREELRQDMVNWHETFPGNLGYDQPREYLITHATRRSV